MFFCADEKKDSYQSHPIKPTTGAAFFFAVVKADERLNTLGHTGNYHNHKRIDIADDSIADNTADADDR